MIARAYGSAAAFKAALEDRLRRGAAGGVDLSRRRQLVVFTRLIARITVAFGGAVVLKGGFALELRLERARELTTWDLAAWTWR